MEWDPMPRLLSRDSLRGFSASTKFLNCPSTEIIEMKHIVPLLIITGLFSMPLVAAAHAHLVQSTPIDGSTVSVAPDHFLLVFSESAHLTALSIQKDGDAGAQKIEPRPKEASDHFLVPAPKLTAGVYTLTFRTIATDDNHITSGSIRFTVAADAKPASPTSQ
jgi:copper transport protein